MTRGAETSSADPTGTGSTLEGPAPYPPFVQALDALVAVGPLRDTGRPAGFYTSPPLRSPRRPDLPQYFIDGFLHNRDALAFSEVNQQLFAEVFPVLAARLEECFQRGDTVVQTDRQICDAPGRSFHPRHLLFGARYLQIPYMWRQLTFDLPEGAAGRAPEIVE